MLGSLRESSAGEDSRFRLTGVGGRTRSIDAELRNISPGFLMVGVTASFLAIIRCGVTCTSGTNLRGVMALGFGSIGTEASANKDDRRKQGGGITYLRPSFAPTACLMKSAWEES